jgi:thiol:disulfide interchange protein
MIRIFLLFLLIAPMGELTAQASDPIVAPVGGASATITQPHVTAELIPQKTLIEAGKSFDVILHLHSDPEWHTYWINPGDAGLATTIKWTLPPGFAAGPIQWPTPEKHNMGPLMTYGYAGDVYLLTTITPPNSNLPEHFDIKAKASWLVCKEECIPGKGEFSLSFNSGAAKQGVPVNNTKFFEQARIRLPIPNTQWDVKAGYNNKPGISGTSDQALWIQFTLKSNEQPIRVGHLYFFPEQANALNANEDDNSKPDSEKPLSEFLLTLTLQQNGEKPPQVSGVLVSDQPLMGGAKAVYISAFPTDAKDIPTTSASLASPASPATTGTSGTGYRPPLQGKGPSPTAPPLLIAVLGAAFIGGLILNLMPCVLPVLSLKVFSLMKHAGQNPKTAWLQGAAFTAGVVISFWVLAGLLLGLRAAGHQLGWGFQMQSPGFVLALIFLFFLLALNLFGVFELGASLVGLDAKATNHLGGLASSFGNGALATLAATPCTAPFMGSALGFAAQQSAFISLLIFTFLALGMATPYLLLTIFPGALRFVPKPGAWMEAFKQFMGFLLMATVIFLVYVFGALVGYGTTPLLLFGLLLMGLAAWVYGRWNTPSNSTWIRVVAVVIAVGIFGCAVKWCVMGAKGDVGVVKSADDQRSSLQKSDDWQPWSPAAVDAALAQNRLVFVDFTAAWCLSCKVNEAVALGTDAVHKAFADKNVALFRADWTQADPQISKTLRDFNRDGVPLYLLYSPKDKTNPQVLPEVLTPGIVLNALNNV